MILSDFYNPRKTKVLFGLKTEFNLVNLLSNNSGFLILYGPLIYLATLPS